MGDGTQTNQITPKRLDTIWTFEDGKKIINFYDSMETTFAFVDTNNDQKYDEIWRWEGSINSYTSSPSILAGKSKIEENISVIPNINSAIVTYHWVVPNPKNRFIKIEYQLLDVNNSVITSWTNVPSPTPNNPSATFTISGLTANTQYIVQMRTESGVIVQSTFTTIIAPSTNNTTWIIVGVVLGVLVIGGLGVWWFINRKNKKSKKDLAN